MATVASSTDVTTEGIGRLGPVGRWISQKLSGIGFNTTSITVDWDGYDLHIEHVQYTANKAGTTPDGKTIADGDTVTVEGTIPGGGPDPVRSVIANADILIGQLWKAFYDAGRS